MNSFVRSKISSLGLIIHKFHARYAKVFPSSSFDICGLDGINVYGLQHILQECAREKQLEVGKICHGLVLQSSLHSDTLICNHLINFYSKCGHLSCAHKVFDKMLVKSIVSYNTLIAGYTQNGEDDKGLNLFMLMHRDGAMATEFTISSVLCACAAKYALLESKQLHALAIKMEMDSNVYVGTSVIAVYAKCGMIDDACLMFDEMPDKSSVTWSSMISGYMQNELYEDALLLFRRAQRMHKQLTKFTLSALISACASSAAAIEGAQLHGVLFRTGFGSNPYVVSALIDMYSKCGRIKEAYLLFSDFGYKSIVLWNAVLAGFSRHTNLLEAIVLFEKMQQMGICPNEVTYASILSACSHSGLVEKGRFYFDLMMRDSNVKPNIVHYSCMVDVLGRAGLLKEAWDFINRMPLKPTASIWGSLLSSCRTHGDYNLAKIAAGHLFEIEPNNAGNHVLLSNVYAANKKWGKVASMRKVLKDRDMKKEIGKSWIEVKSKVHVFAAGERTHPKIEEIYAKLEELASEMKNLKDKPESIYDLHHC